jgi:hypothetical protein
MNYGQMSGLLRKDQGGTVNKSRKNYAPFMGGTIYCRNAREELNT